MGPICRIPSTAAALCSWDLVRAHWAGSMPHSKDSIGFIFLSAKADTVPSMHQPVPVWSCPIHWKRRYFSDVQSSAGSWPSICDCCGPSHRLLNTSPCPWAATMPTLGAELKYSSLGKWPGGRASSPQHRGHRVRLPHCQAGTGLQTSKAVARENYFWKAKDPNSLEHILLELESYVL